MAKKNDSKKVAREVLVVGTKLKDVVKSAGFQSSGELIEAVSNQVHDLLAAAIKRAGENGRKTVRSYDL
ncbi:MAG: hypothetical protein EXR73_01510 [Myxococcales bacterium]|nr:hypothetical protein [Myxococcales bacterium]